VTSAVLRNRGCPPFPRWGQVTTTFVPLIGPADRASQNRSSNEHGSERVDRPGGIGTRCARRLPERSPESDVACSSGRPRGSPCEIRPTSNAYVGFPAVEDSRRTPGGTRPPNLLIRRHTTFLPASTTQSRHVVPLTDFCRSLCRCVSPCTGQHRDVGLQNGLQAGSVSLCHQQGSLTGDGRAVEGAVGG